MNITGVDAGDAAMSAYQNSDSSAGISGHVGDVIDGVVRKVSDEITIDFNGKEAKVSKSTVQNAREGDSVKFKIMDVSNNRIVLKAMDNSTSGAQGVTFTVLETESTIESICSDSDDRSKDNYDNIDNTTGEDAESAYNEHTGATDLEELRMEAFDRLIEAIKSKRFLEVSSIESQKQKINDVMKAIDSANIKNRLPKGVSAVLAEYFVKYDIPVTDEKLEQLGNAFNQAEGVANISSKMIKYMLKNEQPLTVENMYNALFLCGTEMVSESDPGKDRIYDSVAEQVKDIVEGAGYEWNNVMLERTKWLFRNDIPINSEILNNQITLLNYQSDGINSKDLLDSMVKGISEGYDPAQVDLLDSDMDKAEKAVRDLNNISDESLETVIDSGKELTIENLIQADNKRDKNPNNKSDSQDAGKLITARRQLEEIRLSMTINAAKSLGAKGIDVDTTGLSKLVDELRKLESDYYRQMCSNAGLEGTSDQINVLTETEFCRNQISNAPAYILANIADNKMSQTLTECADAASGIREVYDRAGEAYEKLMTAPRSDMGDSIAKAFSNVDDIINDLGLEVNEQNQRIVKILAQNQMDISTDNINNLKTYDAKMQYLLNNIKPDTTLELIREGCSPLDMSMDELNIKIAEINQNLSEQNNDRGESGYGRFLWQLEKEKRITPEERKSYIGIYRLLNQVTKDDTAAVGAVVNAGMEFSLNNLMTVVRSRRDSGMDKVIDDQSSFNTDTSGIETINDQINTAFEYNYEEYMLDQIVHDVTPSKLYDVSDGNTDNMLDKNIEDVLNDIKQAKGNSYIEKEYFDQLAENCRNVISDERVLDFLNSLNIAQTIFNTNCASEIIDSGQTVLRDILKRYNNDDSEENSDALKQDYEEIIDGLTDSLENDTTMQEQVEKAGNAARELLVNKEQGVLSTDDLASLRNMENAIRFNGVLSRKRCYEIPIKTDEGITNINLTLLSDSKDKGRVDIRMNSELYGNVSARFDVKGDKVQGLILAESDDFYQAGIPEDICNGIEGIGMQVLSLGQEIHKVSNVCIPDKSETQGNETASMYRLAKTVIKTISRKL